MYFKNSNYWLGSLASIIKISYESHGIGKPLQNPAVPQVAKWFKIDGPTVGALNAESPQQTFCKDSFMKCAWAKMVAGKGSHDGSTLYLTGLYCDGALQTL